MAQKPIGLEGLNLILSRHPEQVVGVVTNIQPTGWWNSNEIFSVASEYSIPILGNTSTASELVDFAERVEANELLSVQHPNLISKELRGIVSGRAWNLHLSPLPSYRGWNGPSHAIIENATTYGAALHWISEGFDEGDIAFSKSFAINQSDTAKSVYAQASKCGIDLIRDLMQHIEDGWAIPSFPQKGIASYYTRSDLDPYKSVSASTEKATIARLSRALHFPPFSSLSLKVGENEYSVAPLDNTIGIRRV